MRDSPVTAVPPAPGPRRRGLQFSTWVAFLTVATVLLAVILAGTALIAMSGPRDTASDLAETIVPATRELERTNAANRQAQENFLAILYGPAAERPARVSKAQNFASEMASHWARFKKLAVGTPAERELIEEYDALTRESQEVAATAFGLVDSTDVAAKQAAFDDQADLSAQNAALLAEIRERFYTKRVDEGTDDMYDQLTDAQLWILVVAAVISVSVIIGGVLLVRVARGDERVIAEQEAERHREERRANLENQLQRGLEMEPNEASTFEILEAAITLVRPHEPVELLLADSSHAHFHQAFSTDRAGDGPGCPVPSPDDCPAAASGQSRLFLSSTRLDACPFLRNRTPEPRSAACVPVNIAGSSAGVFHTTGPENALPDSNELAELELVARKAGERIGYLRVLARSEMQARIDVLTGLLNRRSLDDAARDLVEEGRPFVVAFADLDHFKDLNDTYGHEIGDRALRLFGRVLRDAIRPDDIAGRFGGEEFVVLLPGSGLQDGRSVAERIRERLRTAVAAATVPPFSVSIGIAAWEPPEDFGETVGRADDAMLFAKRTGRDRVATSLEVPPTEPGLLPLPAERSPTT